MKMIRHVLRKIKISRDFSNRRNRRNYKSMNWTKPGTYVKGCTEYYICTKFESSTIKIDFRNAKKVKTINEVIIRIINEVR